MLLAQRSLHAEALGLPAADFLCELFTEPRDDGVEFLLLLEEEPGRVNVAALIGVLGLGLQSGALNLQGVELPTGICMLPIVLRECIVVSFASSERELVCIGFVGGQDELQSIVHLGDSAIVPTRLPDALPDLGQQS